MATQTFSAIDQAAQTVTAIITILDSRTDTLRACFDGGTAPTSPVTGQLWLDTSGSPYILKIYGDYDGGGAAWHEILGSAKLTDNPECNFTQVKELRVENLGSHESVSAGKDGFLYLLTGTGEMYFQDQAVDGVNKHLTAVTDGTTTDSINLPLENRMLGATPPTAATKGTSPVLHGYLFDATAEKMTLAFRVPANYSADGDLTVRLSCVLNQAETSGDDIDWSGDLRVVDHTEDVTGTSTAVAASLTDIGATVADGTLIECNLTIDYDDANNPVAAGDWCFLEIYRTNLTEVTGVILVAATLVYPCNAGVQ